MRHRLMVQLILVVLIALFLTGTVTAENKTFLFFDSFDRPDAGTIGPLWIEYARSWVEGGKVRLETADTPWQIKDHTLHFSVNSQLSRTYTGDFVVTRQPVPVENVRVEFEISGETIGGSVPVGPQIWLMPEIRSWGTKEGYMPVQGQSLIGVAAWYKEDNGGRRGILIAANGEEHEYPGITFAGMNSPAPARHVLIVQRDAIIYQSPSVSDPIRISLSHPLEKGAQRYLVIAANTYGSGTQQTISVKNISIEPLADPFLFQVVAVREQLVLGQSTEVKVFGGKPLVGKSPAEAYRMGVEHPAVAQVEYLRSEKNKDGSTIVVWRLTGKTAGKTQLQVRDSRDMVRTMGVEILPALSIEGPAAMLIGKTVTITVKGGTGPYEVSARNGRIKVIPGKNGQFSLVGLQNGKEVLVAKDHTGNQIEKKVEVSNVTITSIP